MATVFGNGEPVFEVAVPAAVPALDVVELLQVLKRSVDRAHINAQEIRNEPRTHRTEFSLAEGFVKTN